MSNINRSACCFIGSALILLAGCSRQGSSAAVPEPFSNPVDGGKPSPVAVGTKPPWRVIYDNDTTNVFNCTSPYNPAGAEHGAFDEKMLRASVAEAAVSGVDAQLLQPGHGWVPWWPSQILPLAEHEAWFESRYGVKPAIPVHNYLRKGGNLIQVFLDECHKHKVAALVSYRLNDNHHLEWVNDKPKGSKAHALTKFYADHPEYRIGSSTSKDDRVHNWLIPEVRNYKLSLITEMMELYPQLDGLELDFMRYPNYFPGDTPMEKRVEVMVGFIREIRALLDRTASKDRRHWLGARVPVHEKDWANIGFNPSAWHAAGVEFFNLSPSYRLTQQTSVAAAREAAPHAAIYLELTHTPQTWKFGGPGYDDHCYRRSTDEMLESTARLGYVRGADGMSAFNFVYYRGHGGFRERRGPFNEPPFNTLSKVADRNALDREPGYFFLDVAYDLFLNGRKRQYTMDAVPAEGNGSAILRIQVVTEEERSSDENQSPTGIKRGEWEILVNGTKLEPAGESGEVYPFPTQYKAGFGHSDQYLAWKLPGGLLKDGPNFLTVTAVGVRKEGFRLKWIDIIQPRNESRSQTLKIISADQVIADSVKLGGADSQ